MTSHGIRERRNAIGLGLRGLSRLTGINPGRLSIIERGVQPTFDEHARIEQHLAAAEAAASRPEPTRTEAM